MKKMENWNIVFYFLKKNILIFMLVSFLTDLSEIGAGVGAACYFSLMVLYL
jgi:hypothetical protein